MDNEKKKKIIKEIISYAAILLLVIVIRVFIFDPIRVDGPSMDTTLEDGQILILNKLSYRRHDIERYDIVVVEVEESNYNASTKEVEKVKTKIIKRVIGLPYETIEIKNNKVYANGKELDSSFVSSTSADYDMKEILGLEKIPGDSYFVMGDNREISKDSRYPEIGFIKKDQIVGKAVFRIWPLNKIGGIE